MKRLVQWADKEARCALPISISEDGDSVPMDDICEQLATLYDIVGDLSLERLQEICEAERAGRCIVLQCKPSDVTVYEVRDKKHARGIGVSPRHVACTMVWSDGTYQLCHQGSSNLGPFNLGKQWFLVEEQARKEAESRKGIENGENDGERA